MRARTSCFFVAILGVNFSSPFAAAQEARAPDLTDLRDAVRDASKRGGNMLDVTKALDELAKWLEKGFAELKPGEKAPLPPGLLALRQAVETAGRKGEKVDAIRKELDAIEIALTGKAFQRPKSEPPVEPTFPIEPGFGRRGGFGREGFEPRRGGVVIRGGGGIVIQGMQAGGRGGNSMAITISGNDFSIRAIQGDVKYDIQGTIGEKGPILEKATITDGEKKPVEVKSLKDVADAHKPAVEKLLKSISRG